MNLHKNEVEIVHSAYQQLWRQMRIQQLLKRLLRLPKHSIRVKVDKTL